MHGTVAPHLSLSSIIYYFISLPGSDATSSFVTAPLDVLKIRLQLSKYPLATKYSVADTDLKIKEHLHIPKPTPTKRFYALHLLKSIVRSEGPTALWKGNVPAQLLYLSYSAVQFSTYRLCASELIQLADKSGASTSTTTQHVIPLLAGATAGAVATAATYPLDLLRTRFAAQGAVVINDSLSLPGVKGSVTKKDKVYPSLRAAVTSLLRGEEMFVSGQKVATNTTSATATSTSTTSTRKKSQSIYTRVRGAYRGLSAAELGAAPYMGLFFLSYEALRSPLRRLMARIPLTTKPSHAESSPATGNPRSSPDPPLSSSKAPPEGTRQASQHALADLTASTLAALFSKTAVFPLDTVRKRLQVQGPLKVGFDVTHAGNVRVGGSVAGDFAYAGTIQTLLRIIREEGWRGLYRGWAVGLGKAAPASAVTVVVYERVLGALRG